MPLLEFKAPVAVEAADQTQATSAAVRVAMGSLLSDIRREKGNENFQ